MTAQAWLLNASSVSIRTPRRAIVTYKYEGVNHPIRGACLVICKIASPKRNERGKLLHSLGPMDPQRSMYFRVQHSTITTRLDSDYGRQKNALRLSPLADAWLSPNSVLNHELRRHQGLVPQASGSRTSWLRRFAVGAGCFLRAHSSSIKLRNWHRLSTFSMISSSRLYIFWNHDEELPVVMSAQLCFYARARSASQRAQT